jgi:hypothetical protein
VGHGRFSGISSLTHINRKGAKYTSQATTYKKRVVINIKTNVSRSKPTIVKNEDN